MTNQQDAWVDAQPAALGDLIVGDGSGAAGIVGVGTDGQVLTADSSNLSAGLNWIDLPGPDIPLSTVTTAGDLIVATAASAVSRIAIGSNNQVLTSDGTTAGWAAPPGGANVPVTFNAQSGTTYTLQSSDAYVMVTASNASAIALTINTSCLAVGEYALIRQLLAGQVTVTAGGGVTLTGTPGVKTRAQYSVITVLCTATDTYAVYGDCVA